MARDFDKPRRSGSAGNFGGEARKNFKSKFSRKDASKSSKPEENRPFKREKPEGKSRAFKTYGGEREGKTSFNRSNKSAGSKRFGKSEDGTLSRGEFRKRDSGFKKGGPGRSGFGKPREEKGSRPFGEKRSSGDGSYKKSGPRPRGNRNFDKPIPESGDRFFGKPREERGGRPFRDKRGGVDGSYNTSGPKPRGNRNFDKPMPEGGDKFFRGKPFGKRVTKGRDEDGEERKSFVQSRLEKQRSRVSVKKKDQGAEKSKDGLTRLNKFISNSGVCSRREADDLIKMGLITVNGQSVTEMGFKVKPGDDVRYEGKKLTAEKPVYILLNKPKGFITTTDDPQERKTVMNLIANACNERVYPVGRLDRNTTGLLLLTNDGELADKLTHPSYNVKKIYKAELDKPLTKADLAKIQEGVRLEEGRAQVDDAAIVSEDGRTVGIEIHIGWNRIVRRIFESLGYAVEKLDRVVYAGLDKKDLGRGEWRFLKNNEVVRLKHLG